jgi:hypothetical protein
MPRGEMPKVTPKDLAVLNYVSTFWGGHGRGPTLREIADAMGWSAHGTAQRHVNALLKANRLQRDPVSWDLMTPGQSNVGPSLAPIFGAGPDQWVPAPAPRLTAWRADVTAHGVEKDDLVFLATKRRAQPGDLVVIAPDGKPRLILVEAPIIRKRFPAFDRIADDGATTTEIYPVQYILRELKEKRARRSPSKTAPQG